MRRPDDELRLASREELLFFERLGRVERAPAPKHPAKPAKRKKRQAQRAVRKAMRKAAR